MLVYIDVGEDGTIIACGTTSVNDCSITIEVEDASYMMDNIHLYKYQDGQLVERSPEEIGDDPPEPASEIELLREELNNSLSNLSEEVSSTNSNLLSILWATYIINGGKMYSDVPVKLKPGVRTQLIQGGFGHLIIENG